MEQAEKEILQELGKRIKNARKEAKMSQTDLANKAGIDRSYISMVERGETNITFLKLKKISDKL